MYVLYGGRFTVGVAVEMVLDELGLDYELREVDITRGEHHAPEYLAINPAGWVPALVTPEGRTLTEALAIMLYVADRHGRPGLAPDYDEPLRGPFYSWLFFLAHDLQPAMKRCNYPERFSTDPGDAPRIKARALTWARDRWRLLDSALRADGPYLLGERPSIADVYMSYFAALGLESLEPLLDDVPAVKACLDRVCERPAFGRHIARLAALMADYRAATAGR